MPSLTIVCCLQLEKLLKKFSEAELNHFAHLAETNQVNTSTQSEIYGQLADLRDKSLFEHHLYQDVVVVDGYWVIKGYIPNDYNPAYAMLMYNELITMFGPIKMFMPRVQPGQLAYPFTFLIAKWQAVTPSPKPRPARVRVQPAPIQHAPVQAEPIIDLDETTCSNSDVPEPEPRQLKFSQVEVQSPQCAQFTLDPSTM